MKLPDLTIIVSLAVSSLSIIQGASSSSSEEEDKINNLGEKVHDLGLEEGTNPSNNNLLVDYNGRERNNNKNDEQPVDVQQQ